MIPQLVHLVVALIIMGVLLWAVDSLIPMDPAIKRIIQVVVVLCVVLYVLQYVARFFGAF